MSSIHFCIKHSKLLPHFIVKSLSRQFASKSTSVVLGIETSCDDTGCGIVDNTGNILGEALRTQMHVKYGGIIPPLARDMHRTSITDVVEEALKSANIKLRDIDAVAVTVKPGLPMSLLIGTDFAKYLSRVGNKPLIPIHHMEAHALTVRLTEKVDFPYLVLLASGGHCLLAIVNNVDQFYLLGTAVDNAPGEALDKIARRLKLANIPEFSGLSGGKAIELAASRATNREQFQFPPVWLHDVSCQFSFSGIMQTIMIKISAEEKKHEIVADMLIPDVYNMCAAVQLSFTRHLCRGIQRGIEFIKTRKLIPEDKQVMVLSGGVASNNYIAKAINIVCSESGYKLVRTPPRLCTDNGVMVAWNGMERFVSNIGVFKDREEIEKLSVSGVAPLGENWIQKVKDARIKCSWVKIPQNFS